MISPKILVIQEKPQKQPENGPFSRSPDPDFLKKFVESPKWG
jgi:hypothetical protein